MGSKRAQLKGHPYNPASPPELQYQGIKNTETARPGLFWYHGFGSGQYFSKDGQFYWCQTDRARELAKEDSLQMQFIDSFRYYHGTYLGD
jgi:hypothetical protein